MQGDVDIANQERRRLANEKDTAVIQVRLTDAGHPPIPEFEDLDAFTKAMSESPEETIQKPGIVSDVECFKILFDEKEQLGTVGHTLRRWQDALPGNKICQTEGKVIAPMNVAMGSEAAHNAFTNLVPEDKRISSSSAHLRGFMQGPTLYGNSTVSCTYEPSLCGQIRVQAGGVSKYILAPICDLAKPTSAFLNDLEGILTQQMKT